MKISIKGNLYDGITAKDIILKIIGHIGTSGGTGYVIEYSGEAIKKLSMEGRMTICNMSIEAGARAGLIEPDQKTFDYVKNKPYAPKGKNWSRALEFWKSLPSDQGAVYDKEVEIKSSEIFPQVTWGTSPQDTVPITGFTPDPKNISDTKKRKATERALDYMGLRPNQKIMDISIDKVFIGSCTNGRIEDLREVAKVVE